MLKSKGTISVEPKKGRIVVDVSDDIISYYQWFIFRRYWIRMDKPLHGAHITVFSSKFHEKVDWGKAAHYHGMEVEFEYDEYIIEGGYIKGFLMYYLRVYSEEIDKIKNNLGIVEGGNWKGSHLTICNSKRNSVFPDWPKMISLNTIA